MSVQVLGNSGAKQTVTNPTPNESPAAKSLRLNQELIQKAPAIAEKEKGNPKLERTLIVAENLGGIPGVLTAARSYVNTYDYKANKALIQVGIQGSAVKQSTVAARVEGDRLIAAAVGKTVSNAAKTASNAMAKSNASSSNMMKSTSYYQIFGR